jgi:hypothetical protein
MKWTEGKTKLICECNSSWQYVLHYCYWLVYNILNFLLFVVFISYSINCSIYGWSAMLQAGRSQVRLPMRILIFFQCTSSFQLQHDHGVYSTSNRNEYQNIFGGKALSTNKADNLTANSQPYRPPQPVMGIALLYGDGVCFLWGTNWTVSTATSSQYLAVNCEPTV